MIVIIIRLTEKILLFCQLLRVRRERRLGAPGLIASHQSAGYHNATAYPFVGVALLAVLYAYKKAKTATKVSVAAEEDLE
jgi:hypothetical protein